MVHDLPDFFSENWVETISGTATRSRHSRPLAAWTVKIWTTPACTSTSSEASIPASSSPPCSWRSTRSSQSTKSRTEAPGWAAEYPRASATNESRDVRTRWDPSVRQAAAKSSPSSEMHFSTRSARGRWTEDRSDASDFETRLRRSKAAESKARRRAPACSGSGRRLTASTRLASARGSSGASPTALRASSRDHARRALMASLPAPQWRSSRTSSPPWEGRTRTPSAARTVTISGRSMRLSPPTIS